MLDITIGGFRYLQRSEYSKIIIENISSGVKISIDALEELGIKDYLLVNDAIKIQNEAEKFFSYEAISDSEIIITWINTNGIKNLVIPETINGKKVVEISETIHKPNMETLYIPDTVDKIPDGLCKDCKSLKKVYLSKNITKIPAFAFTGCENLEEINLENIDTIGLEGFNGCKNLKYIQVPNLKVTSPFAFFECEKLKDIIAPQLIYISSSVFEKCTALENITLSHRLVTLESSAFKDCVNLKKINLADTLSTIGESAFENCFNLTKINFPKNLIRIADKAFFNSGLKGSYFLPEDLYEIGYLSFVNCDKLKLSMSRNTRIDKDTFDSNVTIYCIEKMTRNIHEER